MRQEINNAVAVRNIVGPDGIPKPPQQILLGGAGEYGLCDLHAVISDHPDFGYDFCAGGCF